MSNVVHQLDWAAVKKRPSPDGGDLFDIWTWNVYKLKWTRMSQHGSGFGSAKDALAGAMEENTRTANMLRDNQRKPKPL